MSKKPKPKRARKKTASNNYRTRLERQLYRPPYELRKPKIYAFVFKGDGPTIRKKIVEPILGEDFGLAVTGGRFVVVFINHEYIAPNQHSDDASQKGVFSYQEAAIILLVKDKSSPGKRFWFAPVMHVTSSSALIMGREVYGLPKTLATITMPEILNPGNPTPLEIETEIVPRWGGRARQGTVIEINSTARGTAHVGPEVVPSVDYPDADSYFSDGSEDFLSTSYFEGLNKQAQRESKSSFGFLRGLVTPGIFLKQLPDVDGDSDTVFQRLNEANYRPKSGMKPTRRWLFKYQGVFRDYPSYPLATSLGLRPGRIVRSPLAFHMEVDFIAEKGNLYRQIFP